MLEEDNSTATGPQGFEPWQTLLESVVLPITPWTYKAPSEGLEPPTRALTVRCCYRLSYLGIKIPYLFLIGQVGDKHSQQAITLCYPLILKFIISVLCQYFIQSSLWLLYKYIINLRYLLSYLWDSNPRTLAGPVYKTGAIATMRR